MAGGDARTTGEVRRPNDLTAAATSLEAIRRSPPKPVSIAAGRRGNRGRLLSSSRRGLIRLDDSELQEGIDPVVVREKRFVEPKRAPQPVGSFLSFNNDA